MVSFDFKALSFLLHIFHWFSHVLVNKNLTTATLEVHNIQEEFKLFDRESSSMTRTMLDRGKYPGPGGHNNLSNSVLEGLLYFISPLY